MLFKLIAKDTYCLTKIIDTEDYPNSDGKIDTLLEIESWNLQKEYGKKYQESCGEIIIEELNVECTNCMEYFPVPDDEVSSSKMNIEFKPTDD